MEIGPADASKRLLLSPTRIYDPVTGRFLQNEMLLAGITKTVTPHMLRRSCATEMIRNRANPAHVKELLGHEDYSSLDAYVRLEIVDLKYAHRRFYPREQDGEVEKGPQ